MAQNRIANLEGINYQAVAIDHEGQQIPGEDIKNKPVYEREIGVRFTIDQGPNGTETYYADQHEVSTDKYGLFHLVIGKGSLVGGSYTSLMDIPWINGDQWLKVEISIHNNGEYIEVSYQKFMAVPFSFYTDDIADNSITTYKVVDEALQDADIDTGAVTTSEILNETILAEDIGTGSVETSEILNETILAEDIDTGAVATSEILNETIIAEDIATGAVTTAEILNGTIVNEDIADSTIDLESKVSGFLPVSNGGTGLGVVNFGNILIGNSSSQLDTLAVTDSAMLFSNATGKTELYSLTAGPRTFINVDTVNKTIEISAVDQSGGPNKGSGSVSVPNISSGSQVERNFPSASVLPGDIILATLDTDLQGLTVTAYVRQAGQVRVIFFNGSNQNVNLGPVNVSFANFGQP